ncbi:MAG TPA: efflux RND transporter periplasmic adaptor subunit [Rhodanobacteraceae bacterium]
MLSSCGKTAAPQKMPAPEVGVVTVQPQTVPLTRSLVGRLSAFRSANVLARVAGVLLKRDYKEGSEVKSGQLLFRIDPAPYKAALANAQGQLAEAEAAYTNAQFNAKQAVALAPKGYISKTDLQNALATERTTSAAVQAAKATVETARINLGYTNVTSPIAGRAGEQQVTEGALVGQGTPTQLTTVDQIDPLYVNFTISVANLDDLRAAEHNGSITLRQPDKTTVKVSLPNGAAYPEEGTVDFSSPSVDPATGSVNLRAVLPNPGFVLLPGSYVTLTLNMGQRHNAFLVPQAAVQHDVTGSYVLTVGSNGKVARVPVTTDGMHGVDWIITSGLAGGDKVIVSGIQSVQVGGPAKAEAWQPPKAPPAPTGAAAAAAQAADGQ